MFNRMFLALFLVAGAVPAAHSQQAGSGSSPQPAAGDKSKAAAPPTTAAAATATLPPSAPVITVAGVCSRPAPKGGDCKTVVTREEFERLAKIADPQMNPARRQRLAVLYSQLLVFANAAEEQNLDKPDDARMIVKFAELQALTHVLSLKLEADTKVTPEEIRKYYSEHSKQFEEGSLQRVYVPRSVQVDGKEVQIKEEDAKAEAVKLRTLATGGQDFDVLQRKAYADLGLKLDAPNPKLDSVRREGLSSLFSPVFDLEPGAVSEPISESNGLYIFKLTSKREMPLQTAAPEIERTLRAERLQRALDAIASSKKTTFDGQYFGITASTPNAANSSPAGSPQSK